MNSTPSTRVVIVNYNAGETITACIQSVLDSGEPVKVTVYDNASTDGSMDRVQDSFALNENVRVVLGTENIGFARAVNAMAGSCEEEFLLILNPDCELLPAALGHLISGLKQDASASLAGPLVVDRQGAVQKGTLRNFPNPWNSFLTFSGLWRLGRHFPGFRGVEREPSDISEGNQPADAVSGACMLLRREQFTAAGGMDEAYGLHCEDLDLMYRLHLEGYHCLLVPAARVFHQQGVSSRSRPFWVHRQKHLGMQRFFLKFQAASHSFPVRWLVITGIWSRYLLTLPRLLIQK